MNENWKNKKMQQDQGKKHADMNTVYNVEEYTLFYRNIKS